MSVRGDSFTAVNSPQKLRSELSTNLTPRLCELPWPQTNNAHLFHRIEHPNGGPLSMRFAVCQQKGNNDFLLKSWGAVICECVLLLADNDTFFLIEDGLTFLGSSMGFCVAECTCFCSSVRFASLSLSSSSSTMNLSSSSSSSFSSSSFSSASASGSASAAEEGQTAAKHEPICCISLRKIFKTTLNKTFFSLLLRWDFFFRFWITSRNWTQ